MIDKKLMKNIRNNILFLFYFLHGCNYSLLVILLPVVIVFDEFEFGEDTLLGFKVQFIHLLFI